jgi:hypothetical protein
VAQVESAIQEEAAIIAELNDVASKQPYYKYVVTIVSTKSYTPIH